MAVASDVLVPNTLTKDDAVDNHKYVHVTLWQDGVHIGSFKRPENETDPTEWLAEIILSKQDALLLGHFLLTRAGSWSPVLSED